MHAHAGAWLQHEGKGFSALSFYSYRSDQFYNRKGNTTPQNTFRKYELNPYVEYGMDEDLTLGASFFVQSLSQDSAVGEQTNLGIGDPELFARTLLWQDESSLLSLQPLIKLPSHYQKDRLPQAGSDDYDAELSVLYGQNFDWLDRAHYVDARVGYRRRFDALLHDQFKLDARVGLTLSEEWQFVPAAYLTASTNLPHNVRFTESGQNDYDLLKVECNLLYKWRTDQYLQIGMFRHVAGRNAGDGQGIIAATGIRF